MDDSKRGRSINNYRFTREKSKDDSLTSASERLEVTTVELSRPVDQAPYVSLYDDTVGTIERLDI